MTSRDHGGDEGTTGNGPLDQAEWDFCAKGGYDYGAGWEDDEFELEARAEGSTRVFRALIRVASPKEREVLRAALAQLKAGQRLNWEAIARDLGRTPGAVKTQVRRAAGKLRRRNG